MLFAHLLRGRRAAAIALLSAAAGAAVLFWAWDSDVGSVYVSEQGFARRQTSAGYVPVGRFGEAAWPAVVLSRTSGAGEVAFVGPRGQAHRYTGFAGYQLKVLELRPVWPWARPFFRVLRSAERAGGAVAGP